MPAKQKSSTSKPSIIKADPLIILIFLFLLVVSLILGLKVLKYRMALGNTASVLTNQSQNATLETANLIAATISQGSSPLYKQPKEIQAYVKTASEQTKRDIVVVDKNKKIIADTIPVNVTAAFQEDNNGEVASTIVDGKVRMFTESSKDYPHGISQIVVPLKDSTNKIVGAVIVSQDQVK